MNYYSINSIALLSLLSLLFTAVLYFCISFTSTSTSNPLLPFLQNHNFCSTPPNSMITSFPVYELKAVLEKASMPNKTVIIAVVNRAYVEQQADDTSTTTMLDLFLESFWLGEETRPLLDHLLLVAVDQTAYDRCMFKRLHCYRLVTDGVDFGCEKVYMSSEFIKMMWSRTQFLLDVLNHGYSFVFTDVDVMWLRNPFTKLSKNETEDLQISTDIFNGKPRSEDNLLNTGFYYIRSNNKTITLFDTWYNMKDNSTGKKEQDVLYDLMKQGFFRQLGLRVTFLPTDHFSGFCRDTKDYWSVCTVHSNCCSHIKAKIFDLNNILRDWRQFKGIVAQFPIDIARNKMMDFRWSPHTACINSWRPRKHGYFFWWR
ncbi:hypothetical protein LWI29_017333 [Acer saccharum]|uniref:Nucleotide-diphospho-sugar transferase domain-containing protein n=1 Tax=Acer saccharum TaxID=4024 RepID=A0AA39RZ37_ACESA|nr:hypothetical protein LWI29_017333 [Acer saccharum]